MTKREKDWLLAGVVVAGFIGFTQWRARKARQEADEALRRAREALEG